MHDDSDSEVSLGADLLELVKVACELEMIDFELAVSRHICQLLYWNRSTDGFHGADDTRNEEELSVDERLALQRLDSCMAYADKWGLALLSKFLATVQYYMSVETSMASGEMEDEHNKSSMVLADTCFTPMKFGRKSGRHPSSPTTGPGSSPIAEHHHDLSADDIVMRSSPARPSTTRSPRPGAGSSAVAASTADDLHQQVMNSLEEVSFAVNGDSRRPAANARSSGITSTAPAPATVHSSKGSTRDPSPRHRHDDIPHNSYLDAYIEDRDDCGPGSAAASHEYQAEDSLGRYAGGEMDELEHYLDEPQQPQHAKSKSKKPAAMDKKSKATAPLSRSAQKIKPSGSSSSNAMRPKSVVGNKKTKGHGGMYELLMAAEGGSFDSEAYLHEASSDPSMGDYSFLYAAGGEPTGAAQYADAYRRGESSEPESGNESAEEQHPSYIPKRTPGKVNILIIIYLW